MIVVTKDHAQDGVTYEVTTVRDDGYVNINLRVTHVGGKPVDQVVSTSADIDLKELGVGDNRWAA